MTILLIETSARLCSVAISVDGMVVAERVDDSGRSHASLTAPFIRELLDEKGLKATDLNAVAVSSGPGSYTGLRVGVSTAKGIAFGAGIPLIGIGTLDILAEEATGLVTDGIRTIIPLLDARRMEVFTASYSQEGRRLTEVRPEIVTEDSFAAEKSEGHVLYIGDAVEKCRSILTREGDILVQSTPKAATMARLAEVAYKEKRFEDTAYFEPFYLKEFQATVSRKNLFKQA